MLCQIIQGYASVKQRTSATLMPNNDDESRCVRLHVAKSLTGFKLCATTPNNTQQDVQKDARCNIQQCWKLLATLLRPFARGFIYYSVKQHLVSTNS